jgi:hypothetical protein
LKRLKNKEWRVKSNHPTSVDRFSSITNITQWAVERRALKKARKAAQKAALAAQAGEDAPQDSDSSDEESLNGED